MTILDFIYDDRSLSSIGYIICDLEASNSVAEQTNATRTFNNLSMYYGKFMPFSVSTYADRLEFTFDVIKNTCNGSYSDMLITNTECSYLMKWLARSTSHKLKFACDEYANIYYEGSFNVTDLKSGDDRIGLRLNFITNRPFGMYEPILYKYTFGENVEERNAIGATASKIATYCTQRKDETGDQLANTNKLLEEQIALANEWDERTKTIFDIRDTITLDNVDDVAANMTDDKIQRAMADELVITDISDEEGYIYPYVQINCKEAGNVCITNSFDGRQTIINNCSEGETIIITENLILGTDFIDHKVQNDFNYEFLRIQNTNSDKTNRLTSATDIELFISYSPVAKVVF